MAHNQYWLFGIQTEVFSSLRTSITAWCTNDCFRLMNRHMCLFGKQTQWFVWQTATFVCLASGEITVEGRRAGRRADENDFCNMSVLYFDGLGLRLTIRELSPAFPESPRSALY